MVIQGPPGTGKSQTIVNVIAQALAAEKKVLFVSEKKAALDVVKQRLDRVGLGAACLELHSNKVKKKAVIEELKRDKKTILMTTHYIEEAERLCDRVAIIDHGKVIALGTPRELKTRSGGMTRIEVRLSKAECNGTLRNLEGVVDARELDGTYVLHSERPPQTIVSLVKHLESEGNELVSLEIATPSLEDVFIEMTGRRLRD